MTIDFNAEVEKRKESLKEDLFTLLAIDSVRDDTKASAEEPFGPGPVKAMKQFLEIAKRDGFNTRNVDNYVGVVEYGDGAETLGIFAHMDVVPAGSGWESDPFTPVVKDGKIYARGASDDKGPTTAAYYALKILKDLNVPLSKKIRFVIGTDEESGWGDMDYYFTKEDKPDFGFSPDAEFPIINGEKGNVTEYLIFDGANTGEFTLEHFSGGLRENMVPESAKAIFTANLSFADLEEDFEAFKVAHLVGGALAEIEAGKFEIEVVGKSAHGASPQTGVNGAAYLARFLRVYHFSDNAKKFLEIAGHILYQDHYGRKLGVAHKDEKMGVLTMNAGVFVFDLVNGGKISLNFRFPKGIDAPTIQASLAKNLADYIVRVEQGERVHVPHYVPVEDELVATLLKVYEEHTGEVGYEQIIGGGTFGRLMERGVAYGAMFPGYTDTMHQANEFIVEEDLYRAAVIYADAIYRLAK
ncbi:MAG: dipeptidase PepV [Streptococcaceae bacterium]|jgi:dipeptidase PepV|nr:dipeptidase PepV [Streptococcaceae bacterium]